jgi:hypothetical protein
MTPDLPQLILQVVYPANFQGVGSKAPGHLTVLVACVECTGKP